MAVTILNTIDSFGESLYGPELLTNGTFDSGTGWYCQPGKATITGGELVINTASVWATIVNSTIDMAMADGRTYHIVFSLTQYTSGTIRMCLGTTTNGVYNHIDHSVVDTYEEDLTYVSTISPMITFYSGNTGAVMHIDNISIKEIL